MTTKADTSVKWFTSKMPNGPTLRGQAGALIEVLDACLINGFDPRTPDSITVSSGVATVSISAGNPYGQFAVIEISGASVAALNDEWRIDTSAATSFTFLCPGVADGSVTGASIKRAGAGWEKPFSGTNLAAYRSADPFSSRAFLQVNDADANFALVRGYLDMTEVSVGTNPFPTIAQLTETTSKWIKSNVSSADSRQWALVADGRTFYWFPRFTLSFGGGTFAEYLRFGDILPLEAQDPSICGIAVQSASFVSYPSQAVSTAFSFSSSAGKYVSANRSGNILSCAHAELSIGNSAGQLNYPIDKFFLMRPLILEGGTGDSAPLGYYPGVSLSANKLASTPEYSVSLAAGRPHLFIALGTTHFAGVHAAVDILGPWR